MNQSQGRAAAYRKNKAARAEKTFEVELPSGNKFLLRDPNLQMFVVSGALPLGVAEKMEAARAEGKTDEQAFKMLSPKEQIASINFATKLVRYICVSPKIVDNPQTDDEIAPEELLPEDFSFLVQWAQSGGGEAEKLNSFRPQRRDDAVDQPDGEEQRAASQ
jgi:hypothetical protein